MAGKVVPMDVRLRAAVADPGVNVSAFCAAHGVSRQTFYKWRRRYEAEGLAGLEPRSRAPKRIPHRISDDVRDAIVRARKELDDLDLDCGPVSVHVELERAGRLERVPSVATVWRTLAAAGFVTAAPSKRPQVSFRRFEASAPNELWQADVTDWPLPDGTVARILTFLDDHSRLVVRCRALPAATTTATWETFSQAAAQWGLPLGQLTDNGLNFSGKLRGFEVEFETNLRAAGVNPITSRPVHPQTCGKIERFHHTLKTWLRRQPAAGTLAALQDQLDSFVELYNLRRPHQGISRRTPAQRWSATPPAINLGAALPGPTQRTTVTVERGTARVGARWRIHLGAEYDGHTAHVFFDDTHAAVFVRDVLVRALTLDASRVYQPSGRKRGGPRRPPLP
jgi:transposase InsO family protein